MLCPEVWNLKSPQHHLEIKRSSCMKNEIPPVISTHYYNHSVGTNFFILRLCSNDQSLLCIIIK